MFDIEAWVAAMSVVLGTCLCGPVDVGNAFVLGYRCSYTKRLAIVLEAPFFRRLAIVPDKDRELKR